MIREAKEEIGIDIKDKDLNLVHICNRKVKDNAYVDFIFECKEWKGKIEIMEKEKFAFAGTVLTDAFITGAAKYKPYMQLTATTFENTMTFCIAERCTERDADILTVFLADYKKQLLRFIEEVNEKQ